jgi:hypothetical protein
MSQDMWNEGKGTMTTFNDLPAPALRLITRFARTRHIRGTNRYARVCRSWRDASNDSEGQEQLQLLLALEGLPADTISSTSEWLAQHGVCVNTLQVTYDLDTAPLFQQLPLSTAPLVGLVRLEVDGPDSLVALAPALPQLVALTHLRASIGLVTTGNSMGVWSQGVFSAHGAPLHEVPHLQQLCPGLKSLHLNMGFCGNGSDHDDSPVNLPVAEVLPDGVEQLHLHGSTTYMGTVLPCTTLAPYYSLRNISLTHLQVADLDELLLMPGLQEVDLHLFDCWEDGIKVPVQDWLAKGLTTAPQHVTKLAGLLWTSSNLKPLVTKATHLRKLQLTVGGPDAGAKVQQLSVLSQLRHLDINVICLPHHNATAAAVLALSNLQQVTYLSLYTGAQTLPCSTAWAALLPCLTQLRVLAVDRQQLLGGVLAAEFSRLVQLACLYLGVQSRGWWDPTSALAAPTLDVLSRSSTLTDVLYWYEGYGNAAQPLWQRVHQSGLHVSRWQQWRHAAEEGRVVRPRPCPHLPGVWELQQEASDGQSSD